MTDQEQIDALKTQVNCLRGVIEANSYRILNWQTLDWQPFKDALEKTPEQCLAEVKAQAIDHMMVVLDRSTDALSPLEVVYVSDIERYANKLREQAK